MTTTTVQKPASLAGVLGEFEIELASLGVRWRGEFLEARRTRLMFRTLCAATSEIGRDLLAGDPERARIYLNVAARMGETCAAIDAKLRIEMLPIVLDFDNGSYKENAVEVAAWRAKIAAALAR